MEDQKAAGDDKKTSLEIEKLNAEIHNLKYRWWMPSVIQATPAILVVCATVWVTQSSGVLDARRERLAIETHKLEGQKKNIELQIQELSSSLDSARREKDFYKTQTDAVRMVSKINGSSFSFLDDQGYSVSLRGDWYIGKPDHFLEVLKKLSELDDVRSLSVRGISITADEATEISKLTSLRELSLEDCEIDDSFARKLSSLVRLRMLYLRKMNMANPEGLSELKNLLCVFISDTSLTDEGLLSLSGSLQHLDILHIENTKITDKSVPFIEKMTNLRALNIRGTMISDVNIQRICNNRNPSVVYVNENQVSKVTQRNPKCITPGSVVTFPVPAPPFVSDLLNDK